MKLRIDWEQRDVEIARNVRSIADLIINDIVLKCVTNTETARRLRIQALLIRAIDKLPRTKEALDEVVESLEQFQKRRIRKVIINKGKSSCAILGSYSNCWN
ncbi:TnsD family Tn7-like transposition protein [Paenibacillus sp. B2(2019)]|uniref:TnsD family Tn7-like transposition protein n=1 Tax=Paenibacillus sp. B2(2019) TaxID=2607754 RepID=UPI0016600014|nr:TnsD family Tn7-like transposition protein [Paenibacillus sp. B2(2019)]